MFDTYDWLIIGGGIHGVLLAHWLLALKKTTPERLCILDPHDAPLDCWRKRTASVGMTHLRSPFVHHLEVDPFFLRKFVKSNPGLVREPFAPPYDRPNLKLFDSTCQNLIENSKLTDLWRKGEALAIVKDQSGYLVLTESGQLRSRQVVLAPGAGARLDYPGWVEAEHIDSGRVIHLFDEDFDRSKISEGERVLVLGGGISAVQLACSLSKSCREKVRIYSRHAIRRHEFDSDPCWMGPKCMRKFERIHSYRERRKMITRARNRGSISSEADFHFRQALRHGYVSHKVREVERVALTPSGRVDVAFKEQKPEETFDRIVLATGFEQVRPGGELVDAAVEKLDLPVAECGFPILKEDLSWHQGLFVMGGLAELTLGPSARNIIGARKAAERILSISR